jgi:hypothetical protein
LRRPTRLLNPDLFYLLLHQNEKSIPSIYVYNTLLLGNRTADDDY